MSPEGGRSVASCAFALDFSSNICQFIHNRLFQCSVKLAPECRGDGQRHHLYVISFTFFRTPLVVAVGERWGRAAVIACVALAVAVQAIGAFYFPGPASAGSDDFWRVSRYPPLLAARLGPSAFDLPGFTRDLWEPPPLEIRVSAATSVHGDTVRVAVGLAPAVPRGAASPFTVSVDVSEEDGAGRFGFGSALVPGLEGESTVIMEFDLATRAIRVDPGGIAGVTTDRWVGEVGEGRFRAVLGVWRQDSPAFRPVYPLFEFTREGGAVEVVETRGVAPVGVALRVRQGR